MLVNYVGLDILMCMWQAERIMTTYSPAHACTCSKSPQPRYNIFLVFKSSIDQGWWWLCYTSPFWLGLSMFDHVWPCPGPSLFSIKGSLQCAAYHGSSCSDPCATNWVQFIAHEESSGSGGQPQVGPCPMANFPESNFCGLTPTVNIVRQLPFLWGNSSSCNTILWTTQPFKQTWFYMHIRTDTHAYICNL